MAEIETLIVGGGVSGICMAIKLLQAGRNSFVLVEKSGDLGGTWSFNRYPGCCCDVPSHLYSFSFDRNPSWSKMFSNGQEIHQYLTNCARHHGILPHVRLNTLVRAASWDEAAALWHVNVEDMVDSTSASVASTISARFLVRAVGALHVPKYPAIKGIERFGGPSFHSSSWDSSVDLHDKTVAVIGTGASSIQIVPEIAPIAKKLYVCQRTPAWILPRPDFAIAKRWRQLFERIPLLMWCIWWFLYVLQEMHIWGFVGGGRWRRVVERVAKGHMRSSIKEAGMRVLLEPKYEIGCKRVLLSNSFYPALALPNVELITHPILEIQDHGLVLRADSHTQTGHMTYGDVDKLIDVDIIIYATGFDPLHSNLRVIGTLGLDLTQAGFSSMLGTTKHGFPNFFMLLGPNTILGHTSQILIIEAQVRYIISCMALVTPLARSFELRASSQSRYQDLLARRFPNTVWL